MVIDDQYHFTEGKISPRTAGTGLFTARTKQRAQPVSERLEMLAKPRPLYHGTDFFHRPDFRGLFLADNQEAIGAVAYKCVDKINQETISLFNSIKAFKDDISLKNEVTSYYRTRGSSDVRGTADINASKSYKLQSRNKALTSMPGTRADLKTTLGSKVSFLAQQTPHRSNVSCL